jgi:hypothetical protein
MKEIKHRLFLDITLGSTEEEESLPGSESSNEEHVPPVPKKIKIESCDSAGSIDTEKFENTNFQKKDFIGKDMNLAKLITVAEFGFISKTTPYGFFTVQTCTDEYEQQIYREHEFELYNTLEDYPKYNRFVLSTFMFVSLLGYEKDYFISGHISFKLKNTVIGKDLSNYWLVVNENQRHPRYNNWYLTNKWSSERLLEEAIRFKAPFSKFTIIDDDGNNLGCPEEDKEYLW